MQGWGTDQIQGIGQDWVMLQVHRSWWDWRSCCCSREDHPCAAAADPPPPLPPNPSSSSWRDFLFFLLKVVRYGHRHPCSNQFWNQLLFSQPSCNPWELPSNCSCSWRRWVEDSLQKLLRKQTHLPFGSSSPPFLFSLFSMYLKIVRVSDVERKLQRYLQQEAGKRSSDFPRVEIRKRAREEEGRWCG